MGRPRQFDESNLLDVAIEQFWSKGFDDTSVDDVSRIANVGNGSIYAAYGSKRGLFLAAFTRYCDRRAAFVRETVLAAPGSARTAILTLLRAIVDDCAAQPHRRGCLMINSVAALGGRIPEVAEIGARTTAAMEDAVAERLRRVAPVGDHKAIAVLSAHIILVSQGLIQLSRLHASVHRLHEIAEASLGTLPTAWADRIDAEPRKAHAR
ncbi:TetR/AcrR family transcriptional regulator [Nocardia arthritidis]|uniref:TetR family transcriptional regulator n=1 Tax=Nocardia arthritidis TaxID=228602 RepID=A0A6G9YA83_9NOCA|nr:TetR/AcrR family transcriptional regulator [Nocardia arthritidis]QIS10064.1 TetR family transcriptional regulator [Nocardia arthritidis]